MQPLSVVLSAPGVSPGEIREHAMTDYPTPRNPAETYQAYIVPTLFQPWSGELLDRAALMPGEHVPDVACGTGVVSRGAAAAVGLGERHRRRY